MPRRSSLFALLTAVSVSLTAVSVATAEGVVTLPAEVNGVIDTSSDLSVACVSTGNGKKVRAGWWNSDIPGNVVLCEVINGIARGSFVKANACSSADGSTIVGSANGGNLDDISQRAVFCRRGVTTILTVDDQAFEGDAQRVSANGTRIWGWQAGAGVKVPFLWRDDNTVAYAPGDFQSFVNNFSDMSRVEILDCSDDGRFCCGWYDLGQENVRRPFVIDSSDPTTPFEDCFTGLDHSIEGEAVCMSADGSRVFVKRLDDGKTYQTNCTNPSQAIKPIADGDVLFCSEAGDLVVGIDFNRTLRTTVAWTVKPGSKQTDLKLTGDYGTATPTCAGLSAVSIGAIMSAGATTDAGLFRVGTHAGFPALTAARDSLNKPFKTLDFNETTAISDDGRTFYAKGSSGNAKNRHFFVELNKKKQSVWKEKGRTQPGQITQYAYYAYYYALLAASEGDDAYDDLAASYAEAAYNQDASIRGLKYDYWEGDKLRKRYATMRTTQAQYEYYGYLYSYYGAAPKYGPYVEAYAMYAYDAMLADL